MAINQKTLKAVRSAKAIVVFGNYCLWEGDITASLHGMYRRQGLLSLKTYTFARLSWDHHVRIKPLERREAGESTSETTKLYYESLIVNNLGTRSDIYCFSWSHIQAKKSKEIEELRSNTPDKPVFLVTNAGSVMAEAARVYMRLSGVVSNQDRYGANGQLLGLEMNVGSGEKKMEALNTMLRKHSDNLELGDCAVVVSNEDDLPIADRGRFSVSHPCAISSVINATNLRL